MHGASVLRELQKCNEAKNMMKDGHSLAIKTWEFISKTDNQISLDWPQFGKGVLVLVEFP
jgi:hypothetical protein